jgi:hypothetical protein
LLSGEPKFLGYIPQNFSLYRGEVVSQQSRYLSLIDRSMRNDIVAVLKKLHQNATVGVGTKLGDVKDFGQLVTASQREGRPIDSAFSCTLDIS